MKTTKETPRKLLIVLNYWNGDRDMMKALSELISDLEPRRNEQADILFFRRWDAEQMPTALIHRMEEKFGSVTQIACRRRNAGGYPYGSNEMFYDLIERLYSREYQLKYYAFINMEADCCPLHPEWISKMIEAYTLAYNEKKSAAGHFHWSNGEAHLNGAGIYSTDFWMKAGGMNIIGGPANAAYDIYHAKRIVPIAKDVSQIMLDFNRKTITEDDLFSIKKNGEPVYYLHGVKDMSAITAIRNKFVQANGSVHIPNRIRTVCTYYDPSPEVNPAEQKRIIALWKDAWKAAGFNPVVLEEWDASKHPDYTKLKGMIRDMKTNIPKRAAFARLYRWLAFTYSGGGFMVEYDVFPNRSFTNEVVPEPDGFNLLENGELSAVSADRRGLSFLIEAILNERYANSLAVPTDKEILATSMDEMWVRKHDIVKPWNSDRWAEAPLVHFSTKACKTAGAVIHKAAIIEQFLKSVMSLR